MTFGNKDGGLGFLQVLTIIFIVLKLLGVVRWSWLLVLAPFWIPIAVSLILVFMDSR